MDNFFTGVISQDTRFTSASRIPDLNLLEPLTRQAVLNIIAKAGAMGLPVTVFETFRSQQRQQFLYQQKATKLQKVGVHFYGLAADIVRLVGGEPSWKVDYSFLGPLAASEGLVWGGDWGAPAEKHHFVDSDHVQRVTVAQQDSLFSGDWYPASVL